MDAEFLVYEGSTSTAGTFVVGDDEAGLKRLGRIAVNFCLSESVGEVRDTIATNF